jgi:hypothetical protein
VSWVRKQISLELCLKLAHTIPITWIMRYAFQCHSWVWHISACLSSYVVFLRKYKCCDLMIPVYVVKLNILQFVFIINCSTRDEGVFHEIWRQWRWTLHDGGIPQLHLHVTYGRKFSRSRGKKNFGSSRYNDCSLVDIGWHDIMRNVELEPDYSLTNGKVYKRKRYLAWFEVATKNLRGGTWVNT